MYAYDRYVITAADVTLNLWYGRAYSGERHAWENACGRFLTPGQMSTPPLALRGVFITAHHATGQMISGVRIQLYTLPDPMDTLTTIMIKDGLQSASRAVTWNGYVPLGAGFQWRINAGSIGNLVAGDFINVWLTMDAFDEKHPLRTGSGSGNDDLGEPRLLARQKVYAITDVTAATFARLAPGAGHVYIVTSCIGWHNDATARDAYWQFRDVAASMLQGPTYAALAANVYKHLYGSDGLVSAQPLILREGMSLDFALAAKDVGDTVAIIAAVDEYVGEALYLD